MNAIAEPVVARVEPADSLLAAPSSERTEALSAAARIERAWQVMDDVADPEVPVLSVRDLGLVRDVRAEGERLLVVLTPTYSGCPATELIEANVIEALDAAGLGPATVELRRAPAWTTDWISDAGRTKLRDYGIVPPGRADATEGVPMRFAPRRAPDALACPRCRSVDTERIAAFGSTACKALWRCRACGEPFEHFKPI